MTPRRSSNYYAPGEMNGQHSLSIRFSRLKDKSCLPHTIGHIKTWGFTLIEKMTLVAVVGVLSAIALPSFTGFLNRAKLERTVIGIRSALEETQRQAIRNNQRCTITLNLTAREISGPCLTSGDRKLPARIEIATNLIGTASSSGTASVSPLSPVPLLATVGPSGVSDDPEFTHQIAYLNETAPKATMVIQIISDSRGMLSSRCNDDDDGEMNCDSSGSSRQSTIPIQFGTLGTPSFSVATSVSLPNLPADPSGKIVVFLPESPNTPMQCISISNSLGLARIGTYQGSLSPAEITDSGICSAIGGEAQ